MNSVFIRVNGRGNAWPVFIGSKHPFYDSARPDDLGNASYSIIGANNNQLNYTDITWEILIDAGNNTVPYIIRNENRIPETIVLTHSHMDHTVGIDWVAQSYVHLNNYKKKYPLYSTLPCWEAVRKSYQQLEEIIDFKELIPGKKKKITEVPDMFVTAYPVFHGNSGFGASLLLFEHQYDNNLSAKAVFTGDMLTPLLRTKDYPVLAKAKVIYIDCNNRFPYPYTNHESFIPFYPVNNSISEYLSDWKSKLDITTLLAPHLQIPYNNNVNAYFSEFLKENPDASNLVFSIIDFLKKCRIPVVNLIHYSGYEDQNIYHQKILIDNDLEMWANEISRKENIDSQVVVPKAGNIFKLI